MTAAIGCLEFVVLLTLGILVGLIIRTVCQTRTILADHVKFCGSPSHIEYPSAKLTIMRMGCEPWDPPPFAWLGGAAGLAAQYATALILVTQRHDDELARWREVPTLEIAMLNEQKYRPSLAQLEIRMHLPTPARDRHGAADWPDLMDRLLQCPPPTFDAGQTRV